MQAEQARQIQEAQRDAENRAANEKARFELQLAQKEIQIKSLSQALDNLSSEHSQAQEELVSVKS